MPHYVTERPAEPGELCTCGRQAVVVFLGSVFGETGYCGRADGGDRTGPCPFCGQGRHDGRCPDYRLRLDEPAERDVAGELARRQVVVAYTVKHGQRADGWWFVVEIGERQPEEHGPYATEDAMLEDKLERMEELEQGILDP
jgi:hypothetical protein